MSTQNTTLITQNSIETSQHNIKSSISFICETINTIPKHITKFATYIQQSLKKPDDIFIAKGKEKKLENRAAKLAK